MVDRQKKKYDALLCQPVFQSKQRLRPNGQGSPSVVGREFRREAYIDQWAKLTNASQDTASRDIADLLAKGILREGEAGGRSIAYELALDLDTDCQFRSE